MVTHESQRWLLVKVAPTMVVNLGIDEASYLC